MTGLQSDQVLIVLNVPPSLEEAVIDWLLARDDGTGFTSFPVFGHGARHSNLSAAEQVSGRERRQQFQVQLDVAAADPFLHDIEQSFGTAGIRFWSLPLNASGHFTA
ncbi:MAG: DUF3240 family protein [Woeseiaceae bacterium]